MLERAGLLRRSIAGRDHVLSLNAAPLAEASAVDRALPPLLGRPARRPRCVRHLQEKENANERRRSPGLRRRRRPPHHRRLAPKICSTPGSIPRRWPTGCVPAPSAARSRRSSRASAAATRSSCRANPAPSRTPACIASSIGRSAWCSPGSHRTPNRTKRWSPSTSSRPAERPRSSSRTKYCPRARGPRIRAAGPAVSSISTRPASKDALKD